MSMEGFRDAFTALCRASTPGIRLRLAPTPSGFLHLGNGVNFALNWLAARAQPHRKLLLRIDDLDGDRARTAYIDDVFFTLDWLGIDWDEGPSDTDTFQRYWSQHHRICLYNSVLERLTECAEVYACAKSRRDLAPYEGQYPVAFRHQGWTLDTPDTAWRVATPEHFPMADFVVRRRDKIPAYQIASLTDDLFFGTSHAIRGVDLQPSSAAQHWLLEQLGWAAQVQLHFLHHDLLLDEHGQKRSKSAGAAALRTQREAGQSAAQVWQETARLLGLALPENAQGRELLELLATL